jgi:hypothetical protein
MSANNVVLYINSVGSCYEYKLVTTVITKNLDLNKVRYHDKQLLSAKRIAVYCDWNGNPVMDVNDKYMIPHKKPYYTYIRGRGDNIFYFSNHSIQRFIERFKTKNATDEAMNDMLYKLVKEASENKRILNDTAFMLYRMEQGDDVSTTVYYKSGNATFVCRYITPEIDKRHLFVVTIINDEQKIQIDTDKGKVHVTPKYGYKFK